MPQLSSEIFFGVPYAHASRLQLPTSLNETWTGTRFATEYGLTCPGAGTQNNWGWSIGEDCLNLDLVRPTGAYPGQSLPVLVWIYGGGFYQGAVRDPLFNGSYLVETSIEIGTPVIVVTVNSRLSGFGYLNSELTVREGISNLGLRDLWKALEWIQGIYLFHDKNTGFITHNGFPENIEGFGGDKSRVTIWGESSGGLSVELLAQAYSGQNPLLASAKRNVNEEAELCNEGYLD